MAFWKRALAFITIVITGVYLGWEYALAGIIFSLGFNSRHYEYLLLGLLFDALFLFPKGFFTLLVFILIFLARMLEKSLQPYELSSFIARLSLLTLAMWLLLAGFLGYAFWPDIMRPLSLAGISAIKTLGTAMLLLLLYQHFYAAKKLRTKELRILGAR